MKRTKKVLQGYVLDYYGEENLLTPFQIWGIENLHFEEQSLEKINENGKTKAASIIILTYNSTKTIMQCMASVNDNIREYDEVIIVDNNSEDETEETVKKFINNKKQFKFIKKQ